MRWRNYSHHYKLKSVDSFNKIIKLEEWLEMDIDDLLKKPKFKALDDYLTKQMNDLAGTDLVGKMNDCFGQVEARDWFYSRIPALKNQRPYDWCKQGKAQEVLDLIGRIEYGVYS